MSGKALSHAGSAASPAYRIGGTTSYIAPLETCTIAYKESGECAKVFVSNTHHVVRPLVIKGAHIKVVNGFFSREVRVRHPAESFVALVAVGGNRHEVRGLPPPDVLLDAIEGWIVERDRARGVHGRVTARDEGSGGALP